MSIKVASTIQQLRKEYASITSVCCGDTRFIAQALMFLCELSVTDKGPQFNKPIKPQPTVKRKPTVKHTDIVAENIKEKTNDTPRENN